MARVWIVTDVDRFKDEEAMVNAFWKEAEENDGIVEWVETDCRRKGVVEMIVVYKSVVWWVVRLEG